MSFTSILADRIDEARAAGKTESVYLADLIVRQLIMRAEVCLHKKQADSIVDFLKRYASEEK